MSELTSGPTHVVALIDHLVAGGAERVARQVTVHLDPVRFRRTLCVTRDSATPDAEAAARDELEAAGAELLMLRRRGRADVDPWRRFVRFLREQEVGVLHAHKFGSNLWASILRGAADTPVVLAHEHTWSYEGRPLRRLLDRELIARRCDRFLAVSRQDRERMTTVERIPPERTVFVPLGIPDPASTGRDVRAELSIAAEAPVLVTVAALRPQKAFEVLIEAARILHPRHPDLQVLIAGEGEERTRLETEIVAAGLADVVRLLGHRDDVFDVARAASVCVCCSDFEGTPLSVLEYMAAGRPVVATAVGGVPDVVSDGETGWVVPPRDPVALAARLGELLDSPARAQAFGAHGRERQRAQFTIDATVRRLEALYLELLSR